MGSLFRPAIPSFTAFAPVLAANPSLAAPSLADPSLADVPPITVTPPAQPDTVIPAVPDEPAPPSDPTAMPGTADGRRKGRAATVLTGWKGVLSERVSLAPPRKSLLGQ